MLFRGAHDEQYDLIEGYS